jgi:hypothetical protein
LEQGLCDREVAMFSVSVPDALWAKCQ